MLQIAICDDEKAIRDNIKKLVLLQQVQVQISTYGSAAEMLAADKAFDIFLLDIKLADGDGIQAAKMIRKKSRGIIIFITAFLEYVLDAFDVEAFHYLLKPVDERKFSEVFLRAVEEQKRRKKEEEDYLLVKAGGSLQKIFLRDILYIESNGRKVIIHRQDRELETYGKMEEIETRLGKDFFRCHRGFLVQFRYIVSYDRKSITLSNGDEIYISKQKYSLFLKRYMEYLTGR